MFQINEPVPTDYGVLDLDERLIDVIAPLSRIRKRLAP